MKQVFCTSISPNPAASIAVEDVTIPTFEKDEVLLAMIAAPINPADILLITGRHAYIPDLPTVVGIEGVGWVVEVGEDVDSLAIGDLCAVPFGGTWCQFMARRANDLLPLPSDLDTLQASMISVNPVTAYGLLEGLVEGDWVLQNAANSAIGQMIVSVAKMRGIRTINIVRQEAYGDHLTKLGADVVLVGDDDLKNRVKVITNGKVVRRALDAVAGEASGRLYQCLGAGSELFCYGLLSSDNIVLPAKDVVFGDAVVQGYSRLRMVRTKKPRELRAMASELAQLIRQGTLASNIQQIFPITAAQEAVTLASQEGRAGKILLDLRS